MAPALTATEFHAPLAVARPARRCRPPVRTLREAPRLSVVIVNYCQWEYTAELVRQVLGTASGRKGLVEVVVIDNNSPPHPLARRLRRWPGVSLRRWQRNRGFARAVNEGCRVSRGEWFLLLNPDMTLAPGFLSGVLRVVNQLASEDPQAGIIGFGLRNPDGTGQLSSGPFPTFPGTLAGLTLPRHRRKFAAAPDLTQRCRVSWVTGCCLLVRRDCLKDLGGLNEDYFLYYEDVDLCRRARARGWNVWFEPRLAAVHHNPLHSRPVPATLRLITRHSLLTYCSRFWPGWQFRLLSQVVRLEAWARKLLALGRGDRVARDIFSHLGQLSRELAEGDKQAARRRLEMVVRGIEELHPVQGIRANSR